MKYEIRYKIGFDWLQCPFCDGEEWEEKHGADTYQYVCNECGYVATFIKSHERVAEPTIAKRSEHERYFNNT